MRTSVAVFVLLAWANPARAALPWSALDASIARGVLACPTALASLPRVAAALPAAAGLALEIQVPKNDGWVTDLAGLLTATEERELEALMESYRQGTTHDIALLTVADLRGQAMERFALEVFRTWKLGTVERNNGALLVVSKNDRTMRIEVGRGLEGNLTDSIAGRIIREVITPEFKRGRFGDGLKKGIQAIHAAIGGDYGSLPKERRVESGGEVGVVIFLILFAVIVIILIINSRGRGPRGRRRGRHGWPTVFFPTGGGLMGGRGGGGGFSSGGFGGFGGGGGASGGGATGRW